MFRETEGVSRGRPRCCWGRRAEFTSRSPGRGLSSHLNSRSLAEGGRGRGKEAPSDFWTKPGRDGGVCGCVCAQSLQEMHRRTVTNHIYMYRYKKTPNQPHTDSSIQMSTVPGIKLQGETLQGIATFRDNSAPKDCATSSPLQLGHPIEAKKQHRASPTLIPGTTTFIKNYYYVHRKRKQNQVLLGKVCASALGLISLKWLKL